MKPNSRNVNASNATHGPDPSPDLSLVWIPFLNTNPHLSPGWSLGPHPGLGPGRGHGRRQGQLSRLKLVLDRVRDSPTERGAFNSFLAIAKFLVYCSSYDRATLYPCCRGAK